MIERDQELIRKPLREIITTSGVFSELLPFDEYHLVMAQTDVLDGMADLSAVKTFFYRVAPFGGSYAIFAGLGAFLSKLDLFSYKNLVPFLERNGYKKEFIEYVKKRDKLKVCVHCLPENSVAFPSEPIAIFEASLIDLRIIEGIALSELNIGTLFATKWHRIKNASKGASIMEFGRRRAQHPLKASLYSYIAGINSTSNCEANEIFGIPTAGTMGHEYVQSFESEFEAFDKWLYHNPQRPCLLIDTIDALSSGIGNAAEAFKKHKKHLMENNSWGKIGVRLDSGDLAYLAVHSYHKLKSELGSENVTIVLSNDLDENSIYSIFSQLVSAGEEDVIRHVALGVGTKGAVAWGEPALGGVCKLSEVLGEYVIKHSNDISKTTIPGNLRSSLIIDSRGEYVTTLIYFADEDISKIDTMFHPNDDTKVILMDKTFRPIKMRQKKVYLSDGVAGEFIGEYSSQSLDEIRLNAEDALQALDWSYKRTISPHKAKVSLSARVFNVRRDMIKRNIMRMEKK